MKIDINQSAVVTLSARGADILNMVIPEHIRRHNRPVSDYKAGDVYRTQVHSLMRNFGPFMSLGEMSPFESIEVIPWRTAADDEADRMRALKRRMYR